MSSAAERLASNINFSSFSKAKDLKKRLLFTLFALIAYRFGTYVPIPGIDPLILSQYFSESKTNLLGMFDVFSGGALSRMSLFALAVFPYISASIIMQLMTTISSKLEAIKKEGESGRKKINHYTRCLTVLLSAVQGYGLSVSLNAMTSGYGNAVVAPGVFFNISTTISIVAGTMFLMWLGEQITSRGIGNGISLIIFSGIIANLPIALSALFESARTGAISTFMTLFILLMSVAIIMFVVWFERAQRKILIQYPKRMAGPSAMSQNESSHLPLKLNISGVIPPIFASTILSTFLALSSFGAPSEGTNIFSNLSRMLAHGEPLFITVFILLIWFFSFFYTAIVFNPMETADNLKKNGSFIPGIRPGKNTAEYLDYVLTRLTVLGASYLSLICILPEIIRANYTIPFVIGGTSLLIVVSVTIDTVSQIYSHLLAQQYESLIKKSKLRKNKIR